MLAHARKRQVPQQDRVVAVCSEGALQVVGRVFVEAREEVGVGCGDAFGLSRQALRPGSSRWRQSTSRPARTRSIYARSSDILQPNPPTTSTAFRPSNYLGVEPCSRRTGWVGPTSSAESSLTFPRAQSPHPRYPSGSLPKAAVLRDQYVRLLISRHRGSPENHGRSSRSCPWSARVSGQYRR